MIMYVIPTTWSREKVFTLLIEAVDKLRAEAKCTTVCGRRINIFLYSPRTHFSSVKHVLIINLFNRHTHARTRSICWYSSHPPVQTDEHSCHCLCSYCTALEYNVVFLFLFFPPVPCITQTEQEWECWHTVYRHTHPCTSLYIHTLLRGMQTGFMLRGEAGTTGPTFPMYFSLVRRPNGDCVN